MATIISFESWLFWLPAGQATCPCCGSGRLDLLVVDASRRLYRCGSCDATLIGPHPPESEPESEPETWRDRPPLL